MGAQCKTASGRRSAIEEHDWLTLAPAHVPLKAAPIAQRLLLLNKIDNHSIDQGDLSNDRRKTDPSPEPQQRRKCVVSVAVLVHASVGDSLHGDRCHLSRYCIH